MTGIGASALLAGAAVAPLHRWETEAGQVCRDLQPSGPHCQDKAQEGLELNSVSFHTRAL